MQRILALALAATAFEVVASANAATLAVGPGRTYETPCLAFAAASDGDVVEIDSSGNYAGDVCALTKNQLTIRGVGPARVHIDAAGKNAQGKAIWVVQGEGTIIENIHFSGAAVPDANGAGIRQEGKNLTLRNCLFRNNQNGILAGDVAGSEILIEHCEFDHNGAGDGYSHNLYVNHIAKLTFRYNFSHRAAIGHLLKSRAAENYILYNRFSGENDGSASYEIDCPNGGKTYVIGNIIEQNLLSENPAMLAYLEEGSHVSNPSSELFVVNNTFVNHLGRGTFILMGAAAAVPALVQNNVFYGGGTPCSQATARLTTNLEGSTGCFISDADFDYRLQAGSACVDTGSDPGVSGGFSLAPSEQYLHPASSDVRPVLGQIDVGAYEYSDNGSGGTRPSTSQGGTSATSTSTGQSTGTSGGFSAGATAQNAADGCACRAPASGCRNAAAGMLLGLCAAAFAVIRRREVRRAG